MKHSLIWVAVAMVALWIVARIVLAITSVALHLLWIVAVVAVTVWLIRRLARRRPIA